MRASALENLDLMGRSRLKDYSLMLLKISLVVLDYNKKL